MKRRKRMGMYVAPAISPRGSVETLTAPHTYEVAWLQREQSHDLLQSAVESTPEKFVAFVNRMAEARSTSR